MAVLAFSNPFKSCLIKFRIIASISETGQELPNPIRLMILMDFFGPGPSSEVTFERSDLARKMETH